MFFRRLNPHFAVILLTVLLTGLVCNPVRAGSGDDDITTLIRHGAPQLAQILVDRYQAETDGDAAGWAHWEKQRIALHLALEEWEDVVKRAEALPPDTADDVRKWAQTRAAEAELALGHPAAARERLARLIWAPEESLGAAQLAEWRRLIIESYLAEQRSEDAAVALQRYQQDTAQPDEEETRLIARGWLAEGRAAEAADLLAEKTDLESRALALLAELRSQRDSPDRVAAQARALALAEGGQPAARRKLWAVAAEAARFGADDLARIEALESALVLGHGAAGDELPVNADILWDAYLNYGMVLAQRAQLSTDDYPPWFEIGQRLRDVKPVEARALMAVLAWHEPAHPLAAAAHQQLIHSFENHRNRAALLRTLYLDSARFPSLDVIPAGVRYSLAAVALDEGDVPAATRVVGDLPVPAAATAVEALTWQLARARVLLATGSDELGISVLKEAAGQAAAFTPAQRSAMLRAAGVLQGLGRHQAALDMLQGLAAVTPEMVTQRELQFRAGQAYEALSDYQRAALSYLRTAYLAGETGAADAWGQLGRYHAAAVLAKAGLRADARRLYAGLLGADTDPARRAYALRALDQLEGRP
ncbi:MAG: hypothetical protein AABZ84_08275 [Pseudomonadota bacterium]